MILQEEVGDDGLYSYEFNSQAFSNKGGVTEVNIYDIKLQLFFSHKEALYQQGIPSVIFNYDADAQLKSLLLKMFEKTGVVLTIP